MNRIEVALDEGGAVELVDAEDPVNPGIVAFRCGSSLLLCERPAEMLEWDTEFSGNHFECLTVKQAVFVSVQIFIGELERSTDDLFCLRRRKAIEPIGDRPIRGVVVAPVVRVVAVSVHDLQCRRRRTVWHAEPAANRRLH